MTPDTTISFFGPMPCNSTAVIQTTRPCGCPDTPIAVTVDEGRHARWHRQITPLTRADAATLETAYGRPSSPTRTYVDEQFEAERTKDRAAGAR